MKETNLSTLRQIKKIEKFVSFLKRFPSDFFSFFFSFFFVIFGFLFCSCFPSDFFFLVAVAYFRPWEETQDYTCVCLGCQDHVCGY